MSMLVGSKEGLTQFKVGDRVEVIGPSTGHRGDWVGKLGEVFFAGCDGDIGVYEDKPNFGTYKPSSLRLLPPEPVYNWKTDAEWEQEDGTKRRLQTGIEVK